MKLVHEGLFQSKFTNKRKNCTLILSSLLRPTYFSTATRQKAPAGAGAGLLLKLQILRDKRTTDHKSIFEQLHLPMIFAADHATGERLGATDKEDNVNGEKEFEVSRLYRSRFIPILILCRDNF